MNKSLLEQFLEQECDQELITMLINDIDEKAAPADSTLYKEYTFNRFNLAIEFKNRKVVLEDDLCLDDVDMDEIALDLFVEKLKEEMVRLRYPQ